MDTAPTTLSPFGALPPGLLDPSLDSYANSQAMMGLAQGLLQAGAPSFMPKSIGSIASSAGSGLINGYQNGLNNSLRLQQILMQRQGIMATYNALAPKVGSQAAMVYAMNPQLLAAQMKPIATQPGGSVIQPLSLSGAPAGGGGAPGGGAPAGGGAPGANAEPPPTSGPLSPTLAAAVQTANAQNAPSTSTRIPMPAAQPTVAGGGVPSAPGGVAPSVAPGGAVIATNNNGIWDPATVARLGEQQLLGAPPPPTGFGAGALGQINKSAVNNYVTQQMKAQGISPAELTARQAQFPAYQKGVENLTGMETNMGTARTEFENLWPQFQAQVQKVYSKYGTNYPSLNAAINAYKEHSGDPDVIQLGNYANALENQYVRAVSTSKNGPTEGAHSRFNEMLDTNWNPAQINSAGVAMHNEMVAAQNSIPQMMEHLKEQFGLAPKTPANGVQPSGANGQQGSLQSPAPSPYAGAIKTIETGSPQGNYSSIVDAGNGHKVYGAYQVEDTHIGPWTKKWFGQALTPAQFLANPKAQDAVFNGQHAQYVQQYGPIGAAMVWHGGPKALQNPGATDRFGTTNLAYVAKFARLTGQPLVITNPKTGAKLAWQNGQWAPLQAPAQTVAANAQ